MTEVEVPDVLHPASSLILRLSVEDQGLLLLAQFEPSRVTRNVLVQGKVTSLGEWGGGG